MAVMSQTEKHEFKAEIQQLLDIVIHSLYTDKEIFIRELVSNGSDALEKLRFHKTAGHEIADPDAELQIKIELDDKEKTITFTDSGIGMTHDELVENLGTIAHSGSKAFLKELAEGKKPDATLIGQFGVGFYSAFMAASKVEVHTRSYKPGESGWKWTSEGVGSYEIEQAGEAPRGTRIVVHLKDEQKEFAEKFKVEGILKRHSSFVPFPVFLADEQVNKVQAIWTRSKSEIKDEEYTEFYKHVAHAFDEPRYRLHFNADAPLAIQSVLFVPDKNMEKLGMSRSECDVHLYCKKVLIDGHPKGLLPEWLRFLKGVVDSEDLPLNISRETMQDTALVQKLNSVITKRFLKFLDEEAGKDAKKYNEFFAEFGRFLKEGVVTDYANKDAVGKLLRYETSGLDKGEVTSLAEYVSRMKSDQTEIYFALGPSRASLESSPYFEVFQTKGLEVLFLYDPWDEFVMEHLAEFDGKKLVSAEKAELKLDDESKSGEKLSEDDEKAVAAWLKETLGDQIEEVKTSGRLVNSPAILVGTDAMTASMRAMMKQMNPEMGGEKYNLEINPAHAIIVKINQTRTANPDLAKKVAEQLLDNARAAAGVLEDPRSMVKRLNDLLEQVLAKN